MNMEENKIIDSMPLSALTVGQVKEALNDLLLTLGYKPKPQSDTMYVDDTIEFLKDHGYPVTVATLYNRTFKRAIPYSRIGKRLVFSRKELLQWLDSKAIRPKSK